MCRPIKLKIYSITVAFCVVAASLTCGATGDIAENKEEIKYVALGDSIARGYGLSSPETQSYPALINQALKRKYQTEYYNYAVDGSRTTELLSLMQEAVELDNADLVTVCIGANNILKPFTDCLQRFASVIGFGGIVFADRFDIIKTFDELNSILHSKEFSNELQSGIEAADRDLSLIFKEIKARAPQATVLVMLVYSPYHGAAVTLPYIGKTVDLGELSDAWVAKLNEVITAAAADVGFTTVDCYTPFSDKQNLLNVAINTFPPKFSFDPHPNVEGHIYLSKLHLAEL